MSAFVKPLVKLAVLSVLAFAPGALAGSRVSMTEQQPSSEESSQTCHAPRKAPESSAQPARS
jgi:hypothetical protein